MCWKVALSWKALIVWPGLWACEYPGLLATATTLAQVLWVEAFAGGLDEKEQDIDVIVFLNIRHMRHDWDVWAPCKGLNRSGRITNIASSGHFVCTMFMQCSWYSISGRRCGLYFVFLNSLLFPLPQALNLRVFLYFFCHCRNLCFHSLYILKRFKMGHIYVIVE